MMKDYRSEKSETKVYKIASKVKEIMDILEIEETESTKDTPKRVAKMYVDEVFRNVNNYALDELKMTTFKKEGGMNEMVIVRDIPFYSMCEHHLMPFSGKVTVGYVPYQRIIGLSKIPRVVKYFSKKPQLQERLVREIGEHLQDTLQARALFVLAYDTTHTCVTARGVESYCGTDTFTLFGEEMYDYKSEFFTRIGGK